MTKEKTKKNTTPKSKPTTGKSASSKAKTVVEKPKITNGRRIMFLIATIFLFTTIALILSFVSYFYTGEYDQDVATMISDRSMETQNWLGKFGAYLADAFLFKGFGVPSFLFAKITLVIAMWFVYSFSGAKLRKSIFWDLFTILILSITLGFFGDKHPYLGGIVGSEINAYFIDFLGYVGTMLLVIFMVIFYLIFRVRMSPISFTSIVSDFRAKMKSSIQKSNEIIEDSKRKAEAEEEEINTEEEINAIVDDKAEKEKAFKEALLATQNNEITEEEPINSIVAPTNEIPSANKTNTLTEELQSIDLDLTDESFIATKEVEVETTDSEEFIIEQIKEEPSIEENLAAKLVEDFGEFDPTLELSNFKFPTPELLVEHSSGGITINQAELEENKNRILETLRNYKIGIDKIKATVGPTVTLYEIIPEAGVRISKIKSLEDDIALSLAALGIRIIAPIPGKGTIGIEVPNTKPTMVSMRSLITSPKFQNAEMELPIALGKTISNETFVVDLAKMPHLLMAGATGQGKSVGLNAVLTSLLYKKHPAEVKFVLVDPKKVELTLFNKIERHYLAKLPDTEDAIITDNTKVINTLNSLCIEMDNRYSLLKDAMVRNIKEYNEKFKQRRLNPNNGHKFLPYIVLVVDEFADLIMTAGKEVETPIARLAQLARAVGIHLIIATQRPSVNVITGIIKANFPARIAFRVSSKIDSRTILDGPGADQLIGRGDLLYTQGNDMVRVQCAFVDTPEVEKITDYIGSQKGYGDAYLLPEYVGEDSGTALDIDISERDSLFRDAAEIIVTAQQGSASLLQRKLKLGYNRAGRLIDQLEAAGIVGPFEGSKARSVNIPDLISLEQFLDNEKKNY